LIAHRVDAKGKKMARYKPISRDGIFLPVILAEQIQPGTFEFALDHLVGHELDLSALDAKFNNDQTGASAHDPRVLLKIVLLAYSRGLITSRKIEAACTQNVLFIAISGDSQPSYTHIAKFVRELGAEVHSLFTQVLMTCDRLGLIGRTMFAIDGVKLPANASKERSGTHAELLHRAARLDKAAAKIIAAHQAHDEHGDSGGIDAQRQHRIDELQREAQATRDFIAATPKRLNRKGQELKTNVTDCDSAKMATSKGVIQGYAAQAAVDSHHQIIVHAVAAVLPGAQHREDRAPQRRLKARSNAPAAARCPRVRIDATGASRSSQMLVNAAQTSMTSRFEYRTACRCSAPENRVIAQSR
jgi:transposase